VSLLNWRLSTLGLTGGSPSGSIRAISAPRRSDCLLADASKARRVLGWAPRVTFCELVRLMVEADLSEVETGLKGGREAVRRHSLTLEQIGGR